MGFHPRFDRVSSRYPHDVRPAFSLRPRVPVISFDDRMETVEFRVSHTAHITVDSDVCRSCTTQACVTACPAKLFVPTTDGGILFNYEQCFECGTCYLVCNNEGAISWSYPEGGYGVVFRHG